MMADVPCVSGFGVALTLPWLVGMAIARLMITGTAPGRLQLQIGYGYFLGALVSTLVVRLAHALGAPLNFSGLATALALVGMLCLLIKRFRAPDFQPAEMGAETGSIATRFVIGVLLALLVWRFCTMLGIIIEQPLFGWDAMMNWAPKAIVWFENGELTDFVGPVTWLHEATASGPYSLGNEAASTYPEMVPLFFLWHMLGAGTWDHPLLQLPWFLAALNLGIALYGLLRMAGVGSLLAAMGCYCLLSLPYLNVHTVIAGYADLWLAAAFSLGAIMLNEWERRGETALAFSTLLAAMMCIQLKNPGIILGVLLVLGMIRSKLGFALRTELLLLAAGFIITTGILLTGVSVSLPGVGLIRIAVDSFQLGAYGPEQLKFHPEAFQPVMRALFAMANWHLLWYLVLVKLVWILATARRGCRPATLAVTLTLVAGFYIAVFFFSSYYMHAVSFVTLNRAILDVVPALVFWLITQWRQEEVRVP